MSALGTPQFQSLWDPPDDMPLETLLSPRPLLSNSTHGPSLTHPMIHHIRLVHCCAPLEFTQLCSTPNWSLAFLQSLHIPATSHL